MGLIFSSLAHDALAIAAVVLTAAFWYVRHQYGHWQRRGIPHATPSFPFGNFGESFMQRCSFGDNLLHLYRSSQEPVLGIWSMLKPTLFINDPDLVRAVCIKDFAKFQDRGVYSDPERDPLSGHLFSIGGEKWRNLRGKLSPTFTSGKLKAMFSTLVDSSVPLRRYIRKAAANGEVVEMRELVAQFTTNVIASAAFGLDIDAIADPQTDFRRIGRKVFEPSVRNGLINLAITFFPTLSSWLRLRVVEPEVEQFFRSVVQQNMELRERTGVVRKDFFQLLMQLRNGGVLEDGVWTTATHKTKQEQDKLLTLDECAAQSFVFFSAGFETSSTTVSFTLYELAKNVDIQRRVQREISEVLARHNGEITYESVSEMKYLDWCFDETLRKYPPLPLLNRQCQEEWHIPNTQLVVDSNTAIIIPVHALQMDPKYYPDPERYQPERFNPDHDEWFRLNRPYYPFGEGPRNCIGARFGKMQSKVGLICLLQEFSYELTGNTLLPLVMDPNAFLLAPAGGINLRVTELVTE